MNWLLTVETATPFGGIALFHGSEMVDIHRFNNAIPASEKLIPIIKSTLNTHSITPKMLDALAVSIGPGAFTGLRVGLTAVKTMATFLHKPIVTIPTLKALAMAGGSREKLTGAILDARKKEVFGAFFKVGQTIERVTEDTVLPVEKFLDICPEKDIHLIGTGIGKYRARIEETGKSFTESPSDLWYPSPEYIGRLAIEGYGDVVSGNEIPCIVPVYIRRSEAEIHWKRKRATG